jgi:hypothetical protein
MMTSTAEISQKPERPQLPFVLFVILPDLYLSLLVALRPKAHWRLLTFAFYVYINIKGLSFTSGDALQDYSLGGFFSGTALFQAATAYS